MNNQMSERDYERMLDTVRTASEWHSGQWSALYSYSSTGEIHGEDHKDDLLREIDDCRLHAEVKVEREGDDEYTELGVAALDHLRYTVAAWPDEAI